MPHRPLFILTLLIGFSILAHAQNDGPVSLQTPAGKTVTVFEGFDALAPLLRAPEDALLVVNFWATWCAPCVKELPYFEELAADNRDGRVRVLLVNLDFRKQLERRLLPFLDSRKILAEVVVLDDPDANSWIDRVDPSWGGAIPATLFLGPGIREFHEQSFTREQLHTIVSSLIEKLP